MCILNIYTFTLHDVFNINFPYNVLLLLNFCLKICFSSCRLQRILMTQADKFTAEEVGT
uniref:Uncharacterized protein n=1 Tax=Anguilla anguilla TaxID=7936 RepID=A0A0E9WGR1_ANGAN